MFGTAKNGIVIKRRDFVRRDRANPNYAEPPEDNEEPAHKAITNNAITSFIKSFSDENFQDHQDGVKVNPEQLAKNKESTEIMSKIICDLFSDVQTEYLKNNNHNDNSPLFS